MVKYTPKVNELELYLEIWEVNPNKTRLLIPSVSKRKPPHIFGEIGHCYKLQERSYYKWEENHHRQHDICTARLVHDSGGAAWWVPGIVI